VPATATCTTGKALGGGAQVTTSGPAQRVVLAESYPSSATVWTAIGTVITALTANNTMTVRAYVICQ
jgi:hypothetical protein